MILHTPVLLQTAIELLGVKPGAKYVDCTLGTAGHAIAILDWSSPGGQLLGIDADPKSIDVARERLRAYGRAAVLVNENFRYLEDICVRHNFRPVDGILFDLGMSSLQLEDLSRGFSFKHDVPLDMRFNPTQPLTAASIVNTLSEVELTAIIKKYGEERRSRLVAINIINNRPINSALQLANVVKKTLGITGRIHPATRVFQALRIAVNQELVNLKEALGQTINLLVPGGRLVIISYHSIEDRLVKEFMYRESKDCLCPPNIPVCTCGHVATIKLVNRKPVIPSLIERSANPRSRSAKLRAAERL